ncbi:MAG TPA: alpha/beta hydrolase, partial [Chitinophagaceae bacterium]|nr:alpha/beta hydrolase [Chitinophagaceae bacterium]
KETAFSLASIITPAPENGVLPPDENGFIYYDKAKFHSGFAAEQSTQKANFMYASQNPVSEKGLNTPITYAAWKTRPCFGIVATEDKSIDPGLERTMYTRANASITEIKASHTVFMSNPRAVASVIVKAAKWRHR